MNPAVVESHTRYVEKMKFNFPLLSDPDRAIARAYHALKEDDRGIQRSVYVIARDGTIAFAQRGTPPVPEIVAAVGVKPFPLIWGQDCLITASGAGADGQRWLAIWPAGAKRVIADVKPPDC